MHIIGECTFSLNINSTLWIYLCVGFFSFLPTMLLIRLRWPNGLKVKRPFPQFLVNKSEGPFDSSCFRSSWCKFCWQKLFSEVSGMFLNCPLSSCISLWSLSRFSLKWTLITQTSKRYIRYPFIFQGLLLSEPRIFKSTIICWKSGCLWLGLPGLRCLDYVAARVDEKTSPSNYILVLYFGVIHQKTSGVTNTSIGSVKI